MCTAAPHLVLQVLCTKCVSHMCTARISVLLPHTFVLPFVLQVLYPGDIVMYEVVTNPELLQLLPPNTDCWFVHIYR